MNVIALVNKIPNHVAFVLQDRGQSMYTFQALKLFELLKTICHKITKELHHIAKTSAAPLIALHAMHRKFSSTENLFACYMWIVFVMDCISHIYLIQRSRLHKISFRELLFGKTKFCSIFGTEDIFFFLVLQSQGSKLFAEHQTDTTLFYPPRSSH